MTPKHQAHQAFKALRSWAVEHAYPRWADAGVDPQNGGFQETIGQDGAPLLGPRRARVQPRQIYAFAVAPQLGWRGPAREIVSKGLSFFIDHYQREDGWFRQLVSAQGEPLDDSVMLYDQAFGLFGLCQAYQLLGRPTELRELADVLRTKIQNELGHASGGFEEWPRGEGDQRVLPLLSNPHMHLLEASLAWSQAGGGEAWDRMAKEIGELALSAFIDPNGALHEFFDGEWNFAPGIAGRIVEPGHQFEWAWLMFRWGRLCQNHSALGAGMRLLEIGEFHGVDKRRGVAVNALLDDFSIHDAQARLWPQTERLKAAAVAAMITEDDRWWTCASEAAAGLALYLQTPISGLWYDKQQSDGRMLEEPAPASSFYHIVCAILELQSALEAAKP